MNLQQRSLILAMSIAAGAALGTYLGGGVHALAGAGADQIAAGLAKRVATGYPCRGAKAGIAGMRVFIGADGSILGGAAVDDKGGMNTCIQEMVRSWAPFEAAGRAVVGIEAPIESDGGTLKLGSTGRWWIGRVGAEWDDVRTDGARGASEIERGLDRNLQVALHCFATHGWVAFGYDKAPYSMRFWISPDGKPERAGNPMAASAFNWRTAGALPVCIRDAVESLMFSPGGKLTQEVNVTLRFDASVLRDKIVGR